MTFTPAQLRARAEEDLRAIRQFTPDTLEYAGLAQSAIAHTLCAIAMYLDPDDVAEPEVRLPGGRVVRAEQAEAGERKWRFTVSYLDQLDYTFPRYQWTTREAALAAGVFAAGRPGPASGHNGTEEQGVFDALHGANLTEGLLWRQERRSARS